ncbi:MAG TPA: protease pro-enzyme activation domain-containing protein, partial [Candidatus Binataceae bacterium]|nr:protease pro-enzyme activation domain-containing protein [Candidatus Binataceae bacterium]
MLARLLSFVAIFVLATGVTAASASPTPIGVGKIAGERDLGRAPSSVGVRIAVVMKYHHDAELESLTEAQADPDSPLFHHFLTPAQFESYFAPTPAEYGQVITSLQRGGFTISHVFPNRTVVDAIAPAPVASRYFSTDIHRVLTWEGRRTYSNVRPGLVPSEIADLVLTVQGLDAVGRMRPMYEFAR